MYLLRCTDYYDLTLETFHMIPISSLNRKPIEPFVMVCKIFVNKLTFNVV